MSLIPGRIVYEYNAKILSIHCDHSLGHSFDNFLETLWKQANESKVFRYTLNNLETKTIPGKFKFVAQLNPERAIKRRKPQFITNVRQPFNPSLFNFTKVQPSEILCELRPLYWNTSEEPKRTNGEVPTHLIIANVSPLEHCNSLIVPDLHSCHPQVLTFEAVRLVMEVMLLSQDSDLRIGFNSLGGFASVNHLHFHLYYLKHRLYLETSSLKHLAGDCYEIVDYPAEGFAFNVVGSDILDTVNNVMKLISYLLEKEIAHNIFITRGYRLDIIQSNDNNVDNNCKGVYDAIRIFVWARKFSHGAKDDLGFNPALCELAGHLPIKTKEFYDKVSEEEIESTLMDICHDVFQGIREDVKKLFLN